MGHPVHPPCRSRVTQSRLHRTLSRWVLNISREGDSTTSLGSLCQGSITLRVKKFFNVFRGNFLCFNLCPLPLVLSLGTTAHTQPVTIGLQCEYCKPLAKSVQLHELQRRYTEGSHWVCGQLLCENVMFGSKLLRKLFGCVKKARKPFLWSSASQTSAFEPLYASHDLGKQSTDAVEAAHLCSARWEDGLRGILRHSPFSVTALPAAGESPAAGCRPCGKANFKGSLLSPPLPTMSGMREEFS